MSKDPYLGRVIAGRYRVDALLGQGAMARVYRAEQLSMRRDVALKLLHPEIAREREAVLRFEREVTAVTRLRSPHAIVFHDFGKADDLLFIAMEKLEGETLHQRLERGALPPALTLTIVQQICACLGEAHDAGIVHRDLKPDNVFLCGAAESPHVKVLDFGLAKIVEGTALEAITAKNTTVGTPAYLAPERVIAGRASDERADLYALGVMIYEMLTGELPYRAKNVLDMMRAHRDAPIPSAVATRPHLPPALDDFFRAAMAKDPSFRLQRAAAFANALTLALGSS